MCVCHVLLCRALTSQTPELSHLSQKCTLLEGFNPSTELCLAGSFSIVVHWMVTIDELPQKLGLDLEL